MGKNKVSPAYKVTPYLEKLMEKEPCVARQFVPSPEEQEELVGDSPDPLGEDDHIVCPKCIHKYKDRVLIITSNLCFSNCRFCTRRRMLKKRESIITDGEVDKIVDYLNEHKEVRDVIISGGDPLILPNGVLKTILSKIRRVESVEIIRVGTRAPIVQPKRITVKLVNILKRFAPLYINIHVNHPAELTPEVKRATDLMADNGLILGSQTVLLKGVNDNEAVMLELVQKLLRFRIKPYYTYLCDHVLGTRHFWTDGDKAIEMLRNIQKSTSGLCLPHFVRDTEERKVPLA
jgi:lysine 2,3-aminomutase